MFISLCISEGHTVKDENKPQTRDDEIFVHLKQNGNDENALPLLYWLLKPEVDISSDNT